MNGYSQFALISAMNCFADLCTAAMFYGYPRDSCVDNTRLIVQQVTAGTLCRPRPRTLERNACAATFTRQTP